MNSTSSNFIANLTQGSRRRGWYFTPVDSTGIAITAGILIPLMVFGVFANILTIFVILSSKKLKSIFFILIVSLCFSDFFSALLSVLYLYRRTWGIDNWTIHEFFCKISPSGDTATSIATSLHIVVFSLFRLFSLKRPHNFKAVTLFHTRICILVIWIIAIGCGFIPMAIMNEVKPIEVAAYRLKHDNSKTWHICSLGKKWYFKYKDYILVIYVIFFYIPLILVCLTSAGISLIFCRRRIKKALDSRDVKIRTTNQNTMEATRQRKENQAMIQLSLIIGSFILGYLPESAYHIYISLRGRPSPSNLVFGWWFSMISYMLLRLSECLNPIFYNLGSSQIRSETRRCFQYWRKPRRRVNIQEDVKLEVIDGSTSTKKQTV